MSRFRKEIIQGLTATPKKLHSKYFYDKTGDKLFQQIMAMPEYYLTDCELDIFKNQTNELADVILKTDTPFDLVELGAGDAKKSIHLLRNLSRQAADFTYMPIDISGNILNELNEKLKNEIPSLHVTPLAGEYLETLDQASSLSTNRKVVLFLGSNIGNMEVDEAAKFCSELKRKLAPGDTVLIGFDLKKNPQTILNAYNDAAHITAAFNLNLLARINRELAADFNIDQFQHYQSYDPLTGACRSFLISLSDQTVTIGDVSIPFAKDEYIYMEISQKFSFHDISYLAKTAGFKEIGLFSDQRKWFVDVIWEA